MSERMYEGGPDSDIVGSAMNVLARELGLAGTARFLIKLNVGRGDYTRDRHELLEDWTLEEIFAEARRMEAEKSSGASRTRYLARRITTNREQCEGRPCIRGLPIPVHEILDRLAACSSTAQVLQEYPDLEQEDILAVYRYASRVMKRT